MRRVLFSGYYGLGNAGDEAILAASVAMFRAHAPELSLAVLSGSPRETGAALKVDAAPRMSPRSMLREVRRCSLFISGGGSLLQDRTSLKSLLYYLWLLKTARRAGAKTMIFAQGIGPLERPAARRWTATALRQVDAITVRDAESADLLEGLGVSRDGGPEVQVTADPVFALEPQVTDRVSAAAAERPSLAVSLRPWPGVEAILDPLEQALGAFEGELSLQAWPLQASQDLPLCGALARRLPAVQVMREPLTPGEWVALAGWTDLVIGMRLHALIFAAARSVPVLGISYDPKVDALLARLKSRPIGTAASLDPCAVERGIREILEEDEARRRDREARAEHLRTMAQRNVEIALGLLK